MKVRLANPDDAPAIASIYAPYVTASAVSFETEAPDEAEMRARLEAGGRLYPWFVAGDADGTIAGFAYAGAFRARRAYRFAVETSVYVDGALQGQGIGRRLYTSLLPLLEAQGFTQAIAAITVPNAASVRLHEAFGFVPAGLYRDIGYKFGEWRSVGLWQLGLAPPAPQPDEPRPFPEVRL